MISKSQFLKVILYVLMSFAVLSGIVIKDSNIKKYVADVCIIVIILILHIFMPVFAGLEPKDSKVKTMRGYNILIGIIIVCMFFLHNFFHQKGFANDDKLLLFFIVVLILVAGNVAPKLPINGVIGLRFPWTMQDEDTWRVTHKLLGNCSFPAAIIILVGGLTFNPVVFAIGGLVVYSLIPSIYSYVYYKKK